MLGKLNAAAVPAGIAQFVVVAVNHGWQRLAARARLGHRGVRLLLQMAAAIAAGYLPSADTNNEWAASG